jgi:hypothetical protein
MKEKVTKEQAEALKKYKNPLGSIQVDIEYYLENKNYFKSVFIPLKEMGFEKFVRCLVNGYEVELTKEEKILEYYNEALKVGDGLRVQDVLNILEIKIKGVNN